ncbi:hypothetical protein H5410_017389 [Solanum commersonii]|uniref:Uncharacterized protein n=1 Tax=Solanum commersonii TaxID=4109 RepID=A0A9J5ZZ05_SOLCO|nr:hypothetical protein H5410_017389 [Solanum commersonii]
MENLATEEQVTASIVVASMETLELTHTSGSVHAADFNVYDGELVTHTSACVSSQLCVNENIEEGTVRTDSVEVSQDDLSNVPVTFQEATEI